MLKKYFIALLLLSMAITARAEDAALFRYPLYVGLEGGYGATTWEGLVPKQPSLVMSLSAPTFVREGGLVWGGYVGWELFRYFALEGGYVEYPDAHVTFSSKSLFSHLHHGSRTLTTHTTTTSLMAKLMVFIPHTNLRAFSSVGIADVHRNDLLGSKWHLSPSFDFGFNYTFTPHIMAELAGNYTSGYGEAELNPVNDYMPFLYSVYLRLAYRF